MSKDVLLFCEENIREMKPAITFFSPLIYSDLIPIGLFIMILHRIRCSDFPFSVLVAALRSHALVVLLSVQFSRNGYSGSYVEIFCSNKAVAAA